MFKKLGMVFVLGAAAAMSGCEALEEAGGDGGGGGDGVWRVLELPADSTGLAHAGDDLLGFHCSAADRCVVGTNSFSDGGALFSVTGDAVTGVVLTSAEVATAAGTGNDVGFTGFDQVDGRLVARMSKSSAYVSASGDGTSAEQWSIDGIGLDMQGLNSQVLFAESGGTWVHFRNGVVWGASSPPGDATRWTGLWSPGRVPPFPADYDTRKDADDSLCNTNPDARTTNPQINLATASSDLGVIMYPAGGLDQGGAALDDIDEPGVCVSVDGGNVFRLVPFPASAIVATDVGPRGIQCTDDDHCWAYKAYQYGDDNPYVFYTTNATAGVNMTWTAAQLPAIDLDGVTFSHLFFAPDHTHGWIVGDFNSSKPLVFATTDGGLTWQDLSAEVEAAMGAGKLRTGFAFDADQVWIGGEKGKLLASSSGGL